MKRVWKSLGKLEHRVRINTILCACIDWLVFDKTSLDVTVNLVCAFDVERGIKRYRLQNPDTRPHAIEDRAHFLRIRREVWQSVSYRADGSNADFSRSIDIALTSLILTDVKLSSNKNGPRVIALSSYRSYQNYLSFFFPLTS